MPATIRKLAAIMFSDVVGYTAMMGSDENHAFEVLKKNREIHTRSIEKYDGRLIKEIGDGILAQFDSATNAVQCAIEIQKNARALLENKIRIGIHLGDITFENEDVFGDGVNIASRLESVTDPGGIYISGSIYEAIRGKSTIKSEYLGEIELKNVDHLVRTYFVSGDGLPKPSKDKMQKLIGNLHHEKKKSFKIITGFRDMFAPITGWQKAKNREEGIRSIAVLPVENLSKNLEEEWLTAGIHHALIDELSKIHAFRVVSRTSCLKYQNTDLSIPEIARDLRVDGVVEASYYTGKENVNIQVRLIQALPKERQIWMHSYDRTLENVLSIYSDVAKAIVKESNISLTSPEKAHLSKAGKIVPDAYEAYLRGMSILENLTEMELERSLGYFKLALDIDPTYALAYTGIAWYWLAQMQQGFKSKEESMPKLIEVIKKAQDLDNSIAEIHWLLAGVKLNHDWDWENAGHEYRRTFEINPNYAIAHAYYSHYLAVTGEPEKGLFHGELAIKLDPFNALYQAVHGMALKNARKYDDALLILQKVLKIVPNDRIALPSLWTLFHKMRLYEEAMDIANKLYAVKGDKEAIYTLEKGYAKGGYEAAMKRTAEMMITRRDTSFVAPFQIGTLYTRADLKDDALHWLQKAYQERDPNMIYINIDPLFDILREEDRFKKLLQLMKFPKKHNTSI